MQKKFMKKGGTANRPFGGFFSEAAHGRGCGHQRTAMVTVACSMHEPCSIPTADPAPSGQTAAVLAAREELRRS